LGSSPLTFYVDIWSSINPSQSLRTYTPQLPEGASAAAKAKFPHMQGWTALCVEAGVAARVLKLQLALAVATSDGRPLDATSVQTAGALDDVFAYDGPLGASISR
jgi:hypothetical protein